MNWHNYFMEICDSIALNSKCMSRQIGSLIVIDKSIVSTGYNGPPRGVRHCNERYGYAFSDNTECPRRLAGFKSGEGLHLCPAAHAEVNCISNAARLGVSVKGGTLYLNNIIPCKNCASQIINAGIVEVVCRDFESYDDLGLMLLSEAGVSVISPFKCD